MLDETKKIFVMRGISGSGKSTVVEDIVKEELQRLAEKMGVPIKDLKAKEIIVICSADHFFMIDGTYQYNIDKIGEAHDTCLRKFLDAIFDPVIRVIFVDNTHTMTWEYAPYTAIARAFGFEIVIVEVHRDILACFRETGHGVPSSAIKVQYKRFEPTPTEYNRRVIIVGKLLNFWSRFIRWLFKRV